MLPRLDLCHGFGVRAGMVTATGLLDARQHRRAADVPFPDHASRPCCLDESRQNLLKSGEPTPSWGADQGAHEVYQGTRRGVFRHLESHEGTTGLPTGRPGETALASRSATKGRDLSMVSEGPGRDGARPGVPGGDDYRPSNSAAEVAARSFVC
jgi:hypothetical protein